MTTRDENDRLRDGTLPEDPSAETARAPVDTSARRATLAVVTAEGAKLPAPSNVFAEATLIGALLWAGQFAPEKLHVGMVSDLLAAEMFYSDTHRTIWAALEAQHEGHAPTDPTTVHAALVVKNAQRGAGGLDYLDKLAGEARPTNEAQLRAYAESVRDTWARRELLATARQLETLAKAGQHTATMAIAEGTNLLQALDRRVIANAGIVSIFDAARDLSVSLTKPEALGMRTGFVGIDTLIGGIVPGDVTILGARTSVGKSALAFQAGEGLLEQNPEAAMLYISLEMPARDFVARAASSRANVNAMAFRQKTVAAHKMAEVNAALVEIGAKEIYFADQLTQTMQSITGLVQKAVMSARRRKKKLVLVVIDHVLLIKPTDPKRARQDFFADVSRWLKGMASSFGLAVMGLSQIGRAAEKDGGRPKMHQLKWSGSFEEDADNVILLHRPRTSSGVFADVPAQGIVAKARNGTVGLFELAVEPKFVRFSNPLDQRMVPASRDFVDTDGVDGEYR